MAGSRVSDSTNRSTPARPASAPDRALAGHLPPHLPDTFGEQLYGPAPTSLLLGHALRARLAGRDLSLQDVTSPALQEQMDKPYIADRYAESFKAVVGGLLPWAACWLGVLLDGPLAVGVEAVFAAELKPVGGYDVALVRDNGIAEIAVRILGLLAREDLIAQFTAWYDAASDRLQRSRLTVARLAARTPRLEAFGLGVVTDGARAAQRDRMDAGTRIGSLLDLARTILAVNPTEAQALFIEAVEEADRVGDDLHVRWHAVLAAAASLATGHESERAYRLFQIAEVLDHDGELNAMAIGHRLHGMHTPTYFTATSRARDRRTLRLGGLLTAAFLAAGQSTPEQLGLLALKAFNPSAPWDRAVTDLSLPARALATDVLEEFTRFERRSGEVPRRTCTSTALNWSDEEPQEPEKPAARYAAIDLTTEAGWNQALSRVGWREEHRRELAEYAMADPVRRAQVLDALSHAAEATEADVVAVARAAAVARPQTPGLLRARRQLANAAAVRFARSIGTRYDDHIVAGLAGATDTTVDALSRLAFAELGRDAHRLGHQECFRLAAQLATTEGPELAGRVFDDLALLFEDIAPAATSSDGAVLSLPSSPDDPAEGLAGLLWAALGDMAITVRWRAAHAVVLLVRLDRRGELEALARFADGTASVTPFHDGRFPFYKLHARMWLLLALARAAQEPRAGVLSGFADWLVRIVENSSHAANQVLAQRALATLVEHGHVAPADEEVLTRPVVAARIELDHEQRRSRPDPLPYDAEDDGERYPFFLDFQWYWCDDVAKAFGSTEAHVARRAVELARQIGASGLSPRRDPRADASVYEPRRSYPDHSHWPEQDNHGFYLGVHALLMVGSELAARLPTYRHPESDTDSYTGWLARFLPKRPDGRWLSDRRDRPPSPAPETALVAHEPANTWPWSLCRADFNETAGVGREWVTVGAAVTSAVDELSMDTLVESALVPHETAHALLVAAQTSPFGPGSFTLPTTDDEYGRPAQHPFELLPWLDASTHHQGIDVHDERSGGSDSGDGVRFPPMRPGQSIITRFGLQPDPDQRYWSRDGIPVFHSRVWHAMTVDRPDRETGTRGDRLDVRHGFLQEVLRELDRTLVIQVRLRRDHHRPAHEQRQEDDDEFRWPGWSGKVYLVDQTGQWFDL